MSQSHSNILSQGHQDTKTQCHQVVSTGYRKLYVWQKADFLALLIYRATESFPKDEVYSLRSQLRRAAVSVPTNLVEGCGRQNRKELKQFVNIALGSLAEVEYLIGFSLRLGYFDSKTYQKLCLARQDVGGLLWRLFRSLL